MTRLHLGFVLLSLSFDIDQYEWATMIGSIHLNFDFMSLEPRSRGFYYSVLFLSY